MIGEDEQEPDDESVGEQRRAAIRDERQRDPGQRDELEIAARDDERLHADHERETRREERPEVVMRRGGDAKPARHDDEVQAKDRQQADQSQLLSDGGQRVVGMHRGHGHAPADRRQARTQADTQDPTAPEGVQALYDLEAGILGIRPGIQPDVHTGLDVAEQVVQDERSGDEQDQPADDVAGSPGRYVQQGEEHGEEQQRGTEVALDHDNPEGDRPHGDHRREIGQRRQLQRADAGVLLGEERPVLGQVPRQEDHQDHLEQLRRLPRQGADREAEAGAVDVRTEHEHEQQERDPGGGPRVLVGPEPGVGAEPDGEDRDDSERDEQPSQLQLSEAVIRAAERLRNEILGQPLHQEQPEAAQHRHGWQQHLVRPSPGEDERHVHAEQRREVHEQALGVGWQEVQRRELPTGSSHRPELLRRAQRRTAHQEGGGHDREQEQLGGAWAGTDPEAGERPGLRERAHPRPRSRRNRISPTWSSSPNPSCPRPSTGTPLT